MYSLLGSVISQSSLEELSPGLHTSLLEKKPSLSFLPAKSSSKSVERRVGQKMLPELFNKAFSTKSTQYNVIRCKHHKKAKGTLFFMHKRGM